MNFIFNYTDKARTRKPRFEHTKKQVVNRCLKSMVLRGLFEQQLQGGSTPASELVGLTALLIPLADKAREVCRSVAHHVLDHHCNLDYIIGLPDASAQGQLHVIQRFPLLRVFLQAVDPDPEQRVVELRVQDFPPFAVQPDMMEEPKQGSNSSEAFDVPHREEAKLPWPQTHKTFSTHELRRLGHQKDISKCEEAISQVLLNQLAEKVWPRRRLQCCLEVEAERPQMKAQRWGLRKICLLDHGQDLVLHIQGVVLLWEG